MIRRTSPATVLAATAVLLAPALGRAQTNGTPPGNTIQPPPANTTPPASPANTTTTPPASPASPASPANTTPPANATPVAPAAESDEALFERAVTLLQDQQNRQALALLEQLRARHEVPAVMYNLMLAHRALSEYIEARAALQRYRELAEGRLDPARAADVAQMMTDLNANIAHVTVTLRGEGEVTIDGQPFGPERRGRDIELNPGAHVFAVTGRTIRPLEERHELRPGPNPEVLLGPEALDLRPTLRVNSTAPQAEILIDRVLVGSGHYQGRLRAGQHLVQVRASGYFPYSATVNLAPGEVHAVQAQMERDVPLSARWWLWTGIGVLTGAATVAAIIASQSGPQAQDYGTLGFSTPAAREPGR